MGYEVTDNSNDGESVSENSSLNIESKRCYFNEFQSSQVDYESSFILHVSHKEVKRLSIKRLRGYLKSLRGSLQPVMQHTCT